MMSFWAPTGEVAMNDMLDVILFGPCCLLKLKDYIYWINAVLFWKFNFNNLEIQFWKTSILLVKRSNQFSGRENNLAVSWAGKRALK